MQAVLIVVIAVHVLTGVFWAGTTFTLARPGVAGGERLFRPQMGAAVIAVLAGGYLWHALHEGGFGRPEQVLAVGAVAAIVAAGVQGMGVGPAARALRNGTQPEAEARGRITRAHRIAAGFLALTVICMAAARYV